jgi:hypothetical protein
MRRCPICQHPLPTSTTFGHGLEECHPPEGYEAEHALGAFIMTLFAWGCLLFGLVQLGLRLLGEREYDWPVLRWLGLL